MNEDTPKVILNEDYLDLRKYPRSKISLKKSFAGTNTCRRKSSISNRSKTEALRYEKELINSGLKKLVSSYNATANIYQRQNSPKRKTCLRESSMFDPRFRSHRFVDSEEEEVCLKSHSELSVSSKKYHVDLNTPILQSEKNMNSVVGDSNSKVEPTKNKRTMTKGDKNEGHIVIPKNRPERTHHKSKSKDFYHFDNSESRLENTIMSREGNNLIKPMDRYLDSRLREKYSVLKIPWKRTWTIPVFSPKSSSMFKMNGCDNFDRQTYLYDDGTELDSTYIEGQYKNFARTFQNQCVSLFLLGGSICGILLVSLMICIDNTNPSHISSSI
ncbi:hypothetical protein JTB14_018408 [Gonioctena quinquepunctata]|nr:hypothetical protein JTB14_018408 [Gonioctena quinquepunctata]